MNKIFIVLCTFLGFSNLSSGPIQWVVPATTLSTSGVNATDPHLATDSSGDIVAVWVEGGFVKANSKLISGNWGTVATLSLTGASSPRIVSDLNGNATAVWLENGVVKASSKILNGSWGPAISLSGSGASSPAIAVDQAGDVIAAWVISNAVQTSTKLFGANWQTKVSITTTGAALPSISIGGSGANARAVVVWHESDAGINVVKSATKLISGTWSAIVALSNVNMNAAYAQVAVDPNGNANAIWYQYNVLGTSYTNVVLQTSSRLSNGTWDSPINLSLPGIRNPANLTSGLAFDGFGNVAAVWTTSFDDENIHVQSSSQTLSGYWSSPVDIGNGSLYSYSENLAVSKYGDALTVFMFYNGADLIIQASESDISGFINNQWSVPISISQGSENAFPSVTVTASGNALNTAAIWVSSNTLTTSIQATTGVKTLVLPPSALAVIQSVHNFGVFNEYYNTLSWQASTDPKVTGYVIYRNGEFLTRVPSNVLQIIDDNRTQNGSVTYGVASIDSQNTHGQIINVSFP